MRGKSAFTVRIKHLSPLFFLFAVDILHHHIYDCDDSYNNDPVYDHFDFDGDDDDSAPVYGAAE
jgi:hypothetical protein